MEEFINICRNPWCKASFIYTEKDMTLVKSESLKSINSVPDENTKEPPTECPKCKSFNNELSSGVEWKDKTYEGSRFDGTPHQIKYKVTNYR